jgi:RNA polymerase primary sigma factor
MKLTPRRPSGTQTDVLARYLDTVHALGRLTREEEHQLALKARDGDARARHRLVEHNLMFVVAVARRHCLGSVRLEDVIQEGNIGLMRAVQRFDPGAGTRFATYAIWWIRAYIGKYLKEARSIVRPRGGSTAVCDVSLDVAVDDDNEVTHLDRVADQGHGPEQEYLANESDVSVRRTLDGAREQLGELQWEIIQSRLQHDAPPTLESIGARWGLSRERIRQIELKTKRGLAVLLEASRGDAA